MTYPKRIRSICFVAPWAYSIMAKDDKVKGVGGSEVQQSILAREFARRGYDVSMVTLDVGQQEATEIDGVVVHKAFRQGAGLPKTRQLWAFAGKWRAMARARADLYYQQNCALDTGYVAAFAKTHSRYSIYCGASDYDFEAAVPYLPTSVTKDIYRWGLRNMTKVVAQSPRQVNACKSAFGVTSEVIRSCYGHAGAPGRHDGVILWAGSVKPIKRPELFVELARMCPELKFRMVGGGDPKYVTPMRKMAEGLTNIEIVGFVPYSEVEQHFDGASVIVNTSVTEGFPNTFLQGWSRGIPSVSFFDPDTELDGRPVGAVVSSLEEMAGELRRLKANSQLWTLRGDDCRTLFQRQFSLSMVADAYEQLFDRMALGREQGR